MFRHADATERSACDASVAFALDRLGAIDLLVANAGILVAGPLAPRATSSSTGSSRSISPPPFRYGRAVFAPMRAQGGGVEPGGAGARAIEAGDRGGRY